LTAANSIAIYCFTSLPKTIQCLISQYYRYAAEEKISNQSDEKMLLAVLIVLHLIPPIC
jgi:hypothetical protein